MGRTVLMRAAMFGNLGVIEELFDCKALNYEAIDNVRMDMV
jgi:hypothetical protein